MQPPTPPGGSACATDPAGPWSDGITIDGVGGIDPDLAWDEEGNAYVTYSGLVTFGEDQIRGLHYAVFFPTEDVIAGRPAEILAAAAFTGRNESEGLRVRRDGSRKVVAECPFIKEWIRRHEDYQDLLA